MNRSQKITVAVSGAVVVGLVVLAAPAVAGAVGAAASLQSPAPATVPAVESVADAEPVTDAVDAEPAADESRDELNYPGCDDIYYPDAGYGGAAAPVDQGPREFAVGDVVLDDQGVPVSYTVAPGDAIAAIGARFCVFSTGLFYLNEIHLQGALQPGDVLQLRR
jgi:hypothetical protein